MDHFVQHFTFTFVYFLAFSTNSNCIHVNKIDDYCGRIDGLDQSYTGRLVGEFFSTELRLPDRSFDLHGDIPSSILKMFDDLVVGALKPFGCLNDALHRPGIGWELSLSFRVSIEQIGSFLQRILFDSDWLDGFNTNGRICNRLNCRRSS